MFHPLYSSDVLILVFSDIKLGKFGTLGSLSEEN
jgi:hypothetical protein